MSTIAIAERGCGWPKEGGMYFSIGMGPDGIPPEDFLLDPLVPLPSDVIIKNRGLTLMEVDGVWHIIDHVGSAQYPNAADWFEEVSRLGFHQRIETTLSFSKLDVVKSRYFVAHSRVIPVKPTASRIYEIFSEEVNMRCPKGIEEHHLLWIGEKQDNPAICAGMLWADVNNGEAIDWHKELTTVQRSMPSFAYTGWALDEDTKWAPGFFASFPISIMQTLIYKGSMGEHEESAARAVKNGWQGEIEYVEL